MAEINTGESKRGKRKSRNSSPSVDMTPMVDLAFLLITFFMLTTTYDKVFMMKITMPDKNASEVSQKVRASQSVSIIAGENRSVYWYDNPSDPTLIESDYSPQGIRKMLKEKKQKVDSLIVLIKPMPSSKLENVIDIMDEINSTKVTVSAISNIADFEVQMVDDYNKKNNGK